MDKELEKLVNESLNPTEGNDDVPFAENEIHSLVINSGQKLSVRPHPHNYKWTEEALMTVYQSMYDWFDTHPEAVFIGEYFHAKDIEQTISYNTLRYTKGRFPSCDDAMEYICSLLEIRLIKAGLSGKFKEGLTKFVLANKHGWKEKTEQDIVVSTKEVKFEWGNPELIENEKEKDINEE